MKREKLTVRDEFAKAAMQALIASSTSMEIREATPEGTLIRPARIAIPPLAYIYADQMMAERAKSTRHE